MTTAPPPKSASQRTRGNPTKLRDTRLSKEISLRRAANLAQIDPAHLSRVERGEKQLSLPALRRLAVVLGLYDLVEQLDTVAEQP